MFRWLLSLTPLALLSACQFGYEVVARYEGSKLILDSSGGGWFSPDACINYAFTVFDGDRAVWSIEEAAPDQRDCPRGGDFPLTYGVAPPNFLTKVKAERLIPGRLYRIEGGAGINYSGQFKVRFRTVYDADNFSTR